MRRVPANGVTDNESVFMVRQTNERAGRREQARAVCLSDHLLTSLRPLPRGGVGHNTNLLFHRLTGPGHADADVSGQNAALFLFGICQQQEWAELTAMEEENEAAPPTLLRSPCLIKKTRAKHR